MKEQTLLDYIDLGYKDKLFFARKFLTIFKKKRQKEGPEYDHFETIVLILALPEDLSIVGGELLVKITTEILANFEGLLYKIIKSESYKKEIIKNEKIKKLIREGDSLSKELWQLIDQVCFNFFSSILRKTDPSSIKQQKAISFFTLMGITNEKVGSLAIQEIRKTDDKSEIEIKAINNSDKEILNTSIKITHLKDYLEKEIMKEFIDVWYPNEELIIGFPVLPEENEYLLTIKKKEDIMLSRKINLKLI